MNKLIEKIVERIKCAKVIVSNDDCLSYNRGLYTAETIIQEESKAYNEFATDTNVGSKTNADHIRNMSDEELASFLVDVETHGYHDCSVSGSLEMLDWLKAEREG